MFGMVPKANGWKKYKFLEKNLVKGIVPNSQGIYMLFNSSNKPIYIGHSSVLRHRLQSYGQKDSFKEHPTKKKLRTKIDMFAFKTMPVIKARALERILKHRMRFNHR